jgi:hypothetical protein
MQLTGPRLVFGCQRRWVFCGLRCLDAWAAVELADFDPKATGPELPDPTLDYIYEGRAYPLRC